MPNPPQPTVSLKERIAALQQKTTAGGSSTQTNASSTNGPSRPGPLPSASASAGQAAILKSKIAAFEEKGGTPVPRGSFGMGAVPSEEERESSRKRGELYGNRIQHHGVPLSAHRTGGAYNGITPNVTGYAGITPNITGHLTGDALQHHPRTVSDSALFQTEPGATIQATSFSEDNELGIEQDMSPIPRPRTPPRYERRYSALMASPPSPPATPPSRSSSPPPASKPSKIPRATSFSTALEKAKLAEASGGPIAPLMPISPQPTGSIVQNGISPQSTGLSAQATGGGWSYATFGGVEPTVREEPEAIVAQSFDEDPITSSLVQEPEPVEDLPSDTVSIPPPLDLEPLATEPSSPLSSPHNSIASPHTPHTPVIVVSEDPIPSPPVQAETSDSEFKEPVLSSEQHEDMIDQATSSEPESGPELDEAPAEFTQTLSSPPSPRSPTAVDPSFEPLGVSPVDPDLSLPAPTSPVQVLEDDESLEEHSAEPRSPLPTESTIPPPTPELPVVETLPSPVEDVAPISPVAVVDNIDAQVSEEDEPHTPTASAFQSNPPAPPPLEIPSSTPSFSSGPSSSKPPLAISPPPRSATLELPSPLSTRSLKRHSTSSVQSLYVSSSSPSRRTSFNSPSHIAVAHKISSPSGVVGAEEARAVYVSRSPREESGEPGDNYLDGEEDLYLEVVPSSDPRKTFYAGDDLLALDYAHMSIPPTPISPSSERGDDDEEDDVDEHGHAIIYNEPLYDPSKLNQQHSYKVVVNRSKTTAGTSGKSGNRPPPKLKSIKIRGVRGETIVPMSPSGYADLASLVQTSVLLEQQLEGGHLPSEAPAKAMRPPSLPPKSKSEVALVDKDRDRHAGDLGKKRKKSLRDVFGRRGRHSVEGMGERSDPGPSAFRGPQAQSQATGSNSSHYPERKSSLVHRVAASEIPPLPKERPGTSGSTRSMRSLAGTGTGKEREKPLEKERDHSPTRDVVPPTPPPKNNRVVNGLRRLATTATGKATTPTTERPISSVGDLPTMFPRRHGGSVSASPSPSFDASFAPQSQSQGQSQTISKRSIDRPTHRLRHSHSTSSMSVLTSEDSSSVVTPPEDFSQGLVHTASGGIGSKKSSGGTSSLGKFFQGMRRPRTKSSASSLAGSADNALAAIGLNSYGRMLGGKHKEKEEVTTPPRTPPAPPQIPELRIMSPNTVSGTPDNISSSPEAGIPFPVTSSPSPSASSSSTSRLPPLRPPPPEPTSRVTETRPTSFMSTTTAASSNRDSIVDAFPSVPPLPTPSPPVSAQQTHSRVNSGGTMNSGKRGGSSGSGTTSPRRLPDQPQGSPSPRPLPEPGQSSRPLPETPGSPGRQSFEPSWPAFDKMDGHPSRRSNRWEG